MVTIRKAGPEDAPEVARVQIDTWRTAYRDLIPEDYLAALSVERRTQAQRIRLERVSDAVGFFVAGNDKEVIGYATCGQSRDREDAAEGELFAIYVLQSVAGQGVGAQLIRRCEEWFREHRYARAHLWVLEGNHAARGFYRHMGWSDSNVVKNDDIGGVVVREVRYERTFGRE